MRLSGYFLPLLKEAPSEARLASHQLMLRAGLVRQMSAGIYSWLPLGFRVLRKITDIIREEQDRMGAIELLMPTIQPASLWKRSGRYDDYGEEMLRIRDRGGRELLYGPTNEEMMTELFAHASRSWRDCGRVLYHVQWKFRDEIRPRFGVLRSREFLMKDAYSFDLDAAGARRHYQKMFVCYLRTFKRLGLSTVPVKADTGPIGGDLSHEFILLADKGESEVFCDRALVGMELPVEVDYEGDLSPLIEPWLGRYAAVDDMHDPRKFEAEVARRDRLCTRGIEVGHIFYFGEKYSKPFEAMVAGRDGKQHFVHCGSYGIGISRLVGAVIEASHDERGIIWPEAIAPFQVGLMNLTPKDEVCVAACERLYHELRGLGIDVLYDDRDESSGVKFAEMDLIGLPYQMVLGSRGMKEGKVEVRTRQGAEESCPVGQAAAYVKERLSG